MADVAVEIDPLRLGEAAIEVMLEEIVVKMVAGQPDPAQLDQAAGAHQAVSPLQITAQQPDGLPLGHVLHAGDDLGIELFPLHTGHLEHLPQLARQTGNALLNHPLHPRWQCAPIQGRAFDPAARIVLYQVATLLQGLEELYREQGMASRLVIEAFAERIVQAVGLGIQERGHKCTAGLFRNGIEIDGHITMVTREFVHHGLQWMALATTAEGDVIRPEGSQEQDTTVLEMAAEVEEKVERWAVGPLQVVEEQDQRNLVAELAHKGGILFKDAALFGNHIGHGAHLGLLFRQLIQPVHPAHLFGYGFSQCPHQRGAWYKEAHQLGRDFDQHLHRANQDRSQAIGVLGRYLAGCLLGGHLNGEHGQGFAEGQVGIASTNLGIAGALGHDHIRVLGLGTLNKMADQGSLPGPGLPGHETNLPCA